MKPIRRRVLVVLLPVVLASLAAWAAHRGEASPATPRAAAAAIAPAGDAGLQRVPAAPGPGADDRAARIRDLDAQIKSLRDGYHQQLDPLEAQIKALREKFDPQIQSLVDQRRELVESGKTPDVRALDEQEASELASLADREKADIEKVHADYATQRKAIQQKYDDQRRQLRGK